MLASDLGYEKALWLTTLHEGVPGGDAGFMVMDLKNDMVGLEIYLENPARAKASWSTLCSTRCSTEGRLLLITKANLISLIELCRALKGRGKARASMTTEAGTARMSGVWLHEIESNYEINETFAKLM